MAPQPSPRRLRIGVDVGGTNTDGVILDPSLASSSPSKGILAHIKTATTPNPSDGIMTAITSMFTQLEATHAANIRSEDAISSVTIGTTHFVNAVIERDPSRLSRVAVLRLSGPFSKHVPPCVDWPDDMRSLILGYHARVKGGLEVDGSLISDIDEFEIVEQCKEIRRRGGIKAVVINGVFSPIDTVYRQEERAAEIVRRELGGQGEVDVVCSKEVANLGFLERENAAVLNASILRFARRTIREFRQAVGRLGLKGVPVFITQNDGTILKGEKAAELPIKTFSSGPTNSMRGAAFLVQGQERDGKKEGQGQGEAMMVVDIGGTTTDVGLLLPNGFPRQQAAYSELAGVRMNFSCPDIKSIGLGGGSIVRKGKNGITIGPESVGYRINEEALLFGGSTLTTTDCTVLANPGITSIGNASLVKDALTEEETQQFKAIVRSKIEKIIDNMKTSPEDLPAILVGGGAVIAPDELQGASKVLKPRWSEVANAIGAAIARVSSVVDTIKSTETKTEKQFLEEIKKDAIERTIAAGASPESVEVVEVEMLPLQYVENKTRFVVRAAGDFDFTRSYMSSDDDEKASSEEEAVGEDLSEPQTVTDTKPKAATPSEVNVLTYTPSVLNRIWHISETDLTFISTGCYILGTGGGGSPYASMILLRQLLRSGASVRVVSPADVPDSAAVGCGCGAGSPTVSIEKLQGDEMMQAQTELYKALSSSSDQNQNNKATHMIALEIGGGNGLQGMTLGASSNMDIPCVDGDWMGRAYPTKWQTTPVVFNERSPIWSPIAVADGNGNVLVMPKAASDAAVEKIIRAALSQMGSQVGAADPPVRGAEMKRWVVENTVSQAWRLGRAVARARAMNRLDEVAETIVEECGGGQKGVAAKVLFKGKIVGVRRTLRMGHVYGECIIEGTDVTDDTTSTTNDGRRTRGRRGGQGVAGEEKEDFTGKRIKIPFKNENIAAIRIPAGDGFKDDENKELEKQEDVLAIVPDLISVIDAQSGEAVGTPEYRYGLLVIVIGIAASDKWTGSQRGIDLGGPKAFGFDHLKYEPLGKFVKPVCAIYEAYLLSKTG
ncbi:hypothetical protein NEUTE1DRAFT_132793 [Neurospora tetrasperma FGSC 2508]|uniref:Hydantoinase n=1 Tax=Neurospora tetrasperma (strain FGSC 2508 / ATCC MYA-4615 / P0657) TaxID=510951 RepID=F8MZC9_NEUT8|nr:uncharacterized protein NEUTE1DRAFT_132793 [Neurospora tetrasperma FGSC 2508]EGO52020.1 hypothetical protein NEUTE1DRAFT_132793 [Neurospora tetrasperma FGSC 2508]